MAEFGFQIYSHLPRLLVSCVCIFAGVCVVCSVCSSVPVMLRHLAIRATARPVCQRTAARSLQSQAVATAEIQEVVESTVVSESAAQEEQPWKRLDDSSLCVGIAPSH